MSFRLTTLLYLFALVAASLAVFGAWGVVLAALLAVLGWWLCPGSVKHLLSVGLVLWVGYLAIAVHHAREQARASACYGQLYWLAHVIERYHDTHGRLPPLNATVSPSIHVHSWRALLLPSMGHWVPYDFSQSWNGSVNGSFPTPSYYQCPTHAHGQETNCFAVVGSQTAWGDGSPRTFADITDGREQTILLIEASNAHVDWKEPRDLTFDEAVDLLTAPVDPATFDGHFLSQAPFRKPMYYRSAIMADRTYRKLRAPLPRELAIALLTASGGDEVDLAELDKFGEPEWDFRRIGNVTILVVVALLPAAFAARRRIWPREDVSTSKNEQKAWEKTDEGRTLIDANPH